MQIAKEGSNLVIKLSTLEKILSFHPDFRIPVKNIINIKKSRPKQTILEIKIPGAYFPGLIKAGTFINKRGREFWYVTRNSSNFYTVELKDSYYKRLVLGLKNGAPDLPAIN